MGNFQKKIIYVDDVRYSLMSLKERLGQHYALHLAQSAASLFQKLERDTPDLILLDVNMPRPDGFDILEKLRADPRYSRLPVIFITGQYDRQTLLKAIRLGAADLISKPFSDEELRNRIENQTCPEKLEAYKPVILAVDDNPGILRKINALLHREYRVHALIKPEDMKELIRKIDPDLFLLDRNMPLMNGFDLARQIRTLPRHKDTPIVFLTANGSVESVNAAFHLGAADFLVKPIDEAMLREKMALHTKGYLIKRHLWRV